MRFWKIFAEYFVQDSFYCHCCSVLGLADTQKEGGTERQLGNIFTGWLYTLPLQNLKT